MIVYGQQTAITRQHIIYTYIYIRLQQYNNYIQITQQLPMLEQNQDISPTQLSIQFYTKIPQLKIIQQQFDITTIDNQLSIRDLQNQFQLIRAITQTKKHKMKLRSNSVLENKKNRYPQQSIYQHSRLIINNKNIVGITTAEQQDQNQVKAKRKSNKPNYINANYINFTLNHNSDSKIILTQAPLQQTLIDFLSMVVENGITCIVMLCNVTENGKNRCFDYLNQHHLYQSIQVINQQHQISNDSGIQYRRIRIAINNNQYPHNRIYYQFQHILFTQWPDKSVPESPYKIKPILDLCSKHNKIVIHCSAGLGRSGVICVLYKIIKNIQECGQNKISIFGEVRKMREYRYGAVQNNQQYRFIYEYIKYYYLNILSS